MVSPIHVNVVDTTPDWFDWVNLVVGIAGLAGLSLAGLIVAVLSLGLAVKHRDEAIREAARERQNTFELTVLRDLLPIIDSYAVSSVYETMVKVLLAALPERELPLLRLCMQAAETEGSEGPAKALQNKLDEYVDRYPHRANVSMTRRAKLALLDEIRQRMEERVK